MTEPYSKEVQPGVFDVHPFEYLNDGNRFQVIYQNDNDIPRVSHLTFRTVEPAKKMAQALVRDGVAMAWVTYTTDYFCYARPDVVTAHDSCVYGKDEDGTQ